MASRYWVGGSATWDATAGSKWASTSGGAGGQSVPGSGDDVFFDANSGAVAVQLGDYNPFGYHAACRNFDSTGFTGTFPFTYSFAIYGNLTFGAGGGAIQSDRTLSFLGAGTHTITMNGKQLLGFELSYGIDFAGTGTYTLQDALTVGGEIALSAGTLNTNGQNVTCYKMYGNGSTSKTLTLGASTVTFTGSANVDPEWDMTASNTTVSAASSIIKYTDTTNQPAIFDGGDKTYGTVWFDRGTSTGSITFTGSNTFAELRNTGTVAHSMLFTTGTTQTVGNFRVSGSSGKLITINSTTTGTHALVKTGGTPVTSDYLNIQHSVSTPASTWYAGTNSTDNQAVSTAGSGWTFTDAPALTGSVSDTITLEDFPGYWPDNLILSEQVSVYVATPPVQIAINDLNKWGVVII